MSKSSPCEQDQASIKAWLDTWGEYVAAVDFKSAREMFEDDIVGFGTWMDVVEGLENLLEMQWKNVWPTIDNFRFLTDTLCIRMSPDRLLALVVLVWNSTGYHEGGKPYPRPGRATISLRRNSIEAPWKGNHTHLSLSRGVPQKSFGTSV